MRFVSTRGGDAASFNEAVMQGLARDGGLFAPETLPDLRPFLAEWAALSYPELATRFLQLFADDISETELRGCVQRAYANFPDPDEPAPLTRLAAADANVRTATNVGDDGNVRAAHRTADDKQDACPTPAAAAPPAAPLFILELFHGPTLAFKDFALQFLGQLYGRAIRATNRPVNILGATSGDTGSAAIHGMLGQPGAHCFILYPQGRVAALQERQIACTGSPNVHALAVHGTFDDAQAIVKEILGDPAFTAAHALTAVNSINIARILAQCVYYLHTVLRLRGGTAATTDAPLEFIVPTGNFGNVLAGWMLSRMGLDGLRFHVASNANDVVTRFFRTGEYRPGAVCPSLAPSMDIQQASNFERWLWWHFDGDAARVRETLATLRRDRQFSLGQPPAGNIRASAHGDDAIRATIRETKLRHHHTADPHTACALAAAFANGAPADGATRVVLATAHPAKFPETVADVLGSAPTHPTLEALATRPIAKQTLPATADAIRHAIETALA